MQEGELVAATNCFVTSSWLGRTVFYLTTCGLSTSGRIALEVTIRLIFVYTLGVSPPPEQGTTQDNSGQNRADFRMSAIGNPLAGKKRLDSWKEIASFFGRDERTVKRWEKERALPVYRVPGSARGGVFAYPDELTRWLEGSEEEGIAIDSSNGNIFPARRHDDVQGKIALVQMTSPSAPAASMNQFLTPSAPASSENPSVATARSLLWVVPLLLLIAVVGLFSTGQSPTFSKYALAAPHLPNSGAQDLYLKGRYHWNKRTPDDLNQAVDLFTQAIVRDPSYAPPYVGLADSYNLLREFSVMPSSEAFPRAIAAARKAVELDPNSADARTSLAFDLFWGNVDAVGAEREFLRALQLDPSNTRAHHWYATFLIEIGRTKEALDQIERARQLDPSSPAIMADKGAILYGAGQANEAVALLKQIEAADPNFLSAHAYLRRIYFDQGDFPAYFREFEVAARLQHDPHGQSALLAEEKAFASSGKRGLLEARLHRDQTQSGRGSGLGSEFNLAVDYALLDNRAEALHHLQASFEKHESDLSMLTSREEFRNLYDDPQFNQLVAEVGLPPVPSLYKP